MKYKFDKAIAILVLLLTACARNAEDYDASGAFEAEEIIISAEVTGKIMAFRAEEGQLLKQGEQIGYIDSTQLYLTKKQLESQIVAILSRRPEVDAQLAGLYTQLKTARREEQRISNLLKDGAATSKQYDDASAQVSLIQAQIRAQQSSLEISTEGINSEVAPLQFQIDQIEDQLEKCKLINPVNGTVLVTYVEPNEMATPGKALYKLADLSTMTLRAYITGDQLPVVKLNQEVAVLTDNGQGDYTHTKGVVTWINDEAEFTPKTIQTKNERANMVYAIKVIVPNNGTFKIGMYGQIKF